MVHVRYERLKGKKASKEADTKAYVSIPDVVITLKRGSRCFLEMNIWATLIRMSNFNGASRIDLRATDRPVWHFLACAVT